MSLRLATYNVQSGRTADGRYDGSALARSVRALDADLVALQEIDHLLERSGGDDQIADLVAALSVGGTSWTGKALPCGKNSCRKRCRWYSWLSGSSPQRSKSFAGTRPVSRHARSSALVSALLPSGA